MKHLTKVVTVTVVITVGIALLFQAWVLNESRKRTFELIDTRAANRAQSTADRIYAVFAQLDAGLLGIRDNIAADEVIHGPSPTTRASESEMRILLRRWQARMPHVQRVHVISATGQFVYSNLDPTPTETVDDRPYFKEQQQAGDDRFRLSETYFSRVAHEWGMLVSRRLLTVDGKFAGIVVFTISAKSLEAEMTAVDQAQWFFAAFDKNSTLVASNPLNDSWLGKSFPDTIVIEGLEQGRASGRGKAFGLEPDRIWSACKVGELPMVMIAGFMEPLALAQWWRDLGLNLLVAVLLVSGCAAILFFQRRNDRANQHIHSLHERMSLATNSARLGVWEWDMDEDSVVCDETTAQLLQLPSGNVTCPSETWFKNMLPEDRRNLQEIASHIGTTFLDERVRITLQGDVVRHLEFSGIVQKSNNNEGRRVVGVIRDVTESKKATLALQISEERYRQITKCVPDLIWTMDLSGRLTYVNSTVERSRGWTVEEFLQLSFRDTATPQQVVKNAAMIEEELKRATQPGYDRSEIRIFESEELRKDGTTFWAEISETFLWGEAGKPVGIIGTTRDISERKKAEEEKEKLQVQLIQAQKMESIGKLAGGVAHDFNNMLGVILGRTELALAGLDPSQPLFTHLQEIRTAANRSADLTRQLLAFARKQTIEPRVLDLNETVSRMITMLRRLIGEDITLAWLPGSNLRPVKIDPSQVDQILANLCVNAKDAIAGVGRVTIETDMTSFDESYCAMKVDFVPGEYVILMVSDDGSGMDKESLSYLFEPFYTTKELGKGTGLGLATVYGIVKQNRGFINVYSEPGRGSSFKIYLPSFAGKAGELEVKDEVEIPQGHGEMLLLVEDEVANLDVSKQMLEGLGYRVLIAASPLEAIGKFEANAKEIQLLLTDVVMPEMNGRDLAARLSAIKPGLKCLYTSGYTANIIVHHGELDKGVNFLHKPFSLRDLAIKVRTVLDSVLVETTG